MIFDHRNFSNKSKIVIKEAEELAKTYNNGEVEPRLLLEAIFRECRDMCIDILGDSKFAEFSFVSNQEKSLYDRSEGYVDITFPDATISILLKASYLALSNHNSRTSPIFILQSLVEECTEIADVLNNLNINQIDIQSSIKQYIGVHSPYGPIDYFECLLQSERYFPPLIVSWGYDVCSDPNLTDYQKGYLMNALEEYMESGMLRNFTFKEKELLAKLDEKHHHIGLFVRRIKLEMKLPVRPLREGKLAGGEYLFNMDSEQLNESYKSNIKIPDDVLKEKLERLKAKLLGEMDDKKDN